MSFSEASAVGRHWTVSKNDGIHNPIAFNSVLCDILLLLKRFSLAGPGMTYPECVLSKASKIPWSIPHFCLG